MDPVTLPSTDTSTFCRLCLSSINLMTLIRRDAADLAEHEPLLALLRNHLRLQLDELQDFPCAVCEVCITVLRDFDALHQNARKYSRALRDLLQEKYSTTPTNHDSKRLAQVRFSTITQMQPVLENVLLEICDAPLQAEDEANEQRILQQDEIVLEEYHVTDVASDDERVTVEPKKYVPEIRGQISRLVPVVKSPMARPYELANGGPSRKVLHPAVVRGRIVGSSPSSPTVNSNKTQPFTQDSKSINRTAPQTVRVATKALSVSAVHQARDLDTDGGAVQATAKKLFRCEHCSSRFVEMKNYYNHVCKKSYKEVPQFNRKDRAPPVEVDLQRFQCGVCGASYRNKLHFNKHEYEAHGICNEDYGVKCSICNMMFSQKQDYRLHVTAMHPSDIKFTIEMSSNKSANEGEISLKKVVKKIN